MEEKRFIISPPEDFDMLRILLVAVLVAFCVTWNKHYIETKDTSIQGYIEYLKEKYFYKKKD